MNPPRVSGSPQLTLPGSPEFSAYEDIAEMERLSSSGPLDGARLERAQGLVQRTGRDWMALAEPAASNVRQAAARLAQVIERSEQRLPRESLPLSALGGGERIRQAPPASVRLETAIARAARGAPETGAPADAAQRVVNQLFSGSVRSRETLGMMAATSPQQVRRSVTRAVGEANAPVVLHALREAAGTQFHELMRQEASRSVEALAQRFERARDGRGLDEMLATVHGTDGPGLLRGLRAMGADVSELARLDSERDRLPRNERPAMEARMRPLVAEAMRDAAASVHDKAGEIGSMAGGDWMGELYTLYPRAAARVSLGNGERLPEEVSAGISRGRSFVEDAVAAHARERLDRRATAETTGAVAMIVAGVATSVLTGGSGLAGVIACVTLNGSREALEVMDNYKQAERQGASAMAGTQHMDVAETAGAEADVSAAAAVAGALFDGVLGSAEVLAHAAHGATHVASRADRIAEASLHAVNVSPMAASHLNHELHRRHAAHERANASR